VALSCGVEVLLGKVREETIEVECVVSWEDLKVERIVDIDSFEMLSVLKACFGRRILVYWMLCCLILGRD
jgi:hypothetical protein